MTSEGPWACGYYHMQRRRLLGATCRDASPKRCRTPRLSCLSAGPWLCVHMVPTCCRRQAVTFGTLNPTRLTDCCQMRCRRCPSARHTPCCLIAVTSGTAPSATLCLLVTFKRSMGLSRVACCSLTSVQDDIDKLADLTKPSSPSSTAVASPPPPVKQAFVDDRAPPMFESAKPATSESVKVQSGAWGQVFLRVCIISH